MDASVERKHTQYELRTLQQGPNSFFITCGESGVYGSAPMALDVHESLFTDEEMQQVHDCLALLETKFALAHQAREDELEIEGLKAPRDKVHALVKAHDEVQKQTAEAKAKLEGVLNEGITKHVEINRVLDQKAQEIEARHNHILSQDEEIKAREDHLATLTAYLEELKAAKAAG